MKRREFLKIGSLFTLASGLGLTEISATPKKKKQTSIAKNILFLVSDGMSQGTLNMADMLLQRQYGRESVWMSAYRSNKLSRSLMETASSSSLVTDSAAGSSAWGAGVRVSNGSLNIDANDKSWEPILQKFKRAGKKVGCVTTVPVTHATPAGFCVNNKSRNSQPEIAKDYINLKFDVMMGGGLEHFTQRADKENLQIAFENVGGKVVTNKKMMDELQPGKPILGIFSENALPYTIDQNSDNNLKNTIPTLASMTQKAIELMQDATNGFVLQVEGGKVDWAAHANDPLGLLYDQIAFDDAIKVALDFAENRNDTLVIITSDHGNANPGLIYGKKADMQFDSVQKAKQSNDWVLKNIPQQSSASQITAFIEAHQGWVLSKEQADYMAIIYQSISEKERSKYTKLPFKELGEWQKTAFGIGWIGMEHSADYVELASFGPNAKPLNGFVKNYELHNWMLESAGLSAYCNKETN